MKKIIAVITIAFLLITACLIYLVKKGVSLRSAPIITPSVVSADENNMAKGVLLRLAPQFQTAHYILWGVLPETAESQEFLKNAKAGYEELYKKPVHILDNAAEATSEQLQACGEPCWLLLPNTMANELGANTFIEQKIRPLNQEYFNLTWIPFQTGVEVPENCLSEKRLDFDCLKLLSIHESQRKMKEAGKRYFFMRQYMDRDFFLFVQDSPTK